MVALVILFMAVHYISLTAFEILSYALALLGFSCSYKILNLPLRVMPVIS
jgi:hypothetical protein